MRLKLVHILNKLDGEREINSINSLSKLKDLGVDYIQQVTPLYEGDEWQKIPPISNYPHGKGHYGLYLNYKNAIKENFTEDLDALIICECDAILNISHDEFINEIQRTLNFCEKYNVYQFSWGSNKINGVQQGIVAKTDEDYPNYCIVNKIIQTHFIILTKQSRNFYLNKIEKTGWAGSDIWLNIMIHTEFTEPGRQATVFNTLAYQYEGLSLIDNFVKGEKKENKTMEYKNRDEFLELIDKLNLKTGCEIGVYKGDFSIKILENTNLSKLYLIDPWKHLDSYNDISNHNNNEFDLILEGVKNKIENHKDRVEIVRDLSENAVLNFKDNYFDFLYLDADHSYEASKKDIAMWYSKVKPGGIFSGHDYLNGSLPQGEFGVKRAIDKFSEEHNLNINITGEEHETRAYPSLEIMVYNKTIS